MARPTKSANSYFDKIESDIRSNRSTLSLVLGALIVLVVGVLIFNYFNRQKSQLGPAEQTTKQEDVSPEKLPGKYTVKEGDTLFLIAEKYYKDGYQYEKIAQANKLANVNLVEVGQVLEIPTLSQPTSSPQATEAPATGGSNMTLWGPRIEDDTYTVVEGDWLSKIAGRAYGDIMTYQKLAQANNITNPDLILPGMVLKIPR